MKQIDAAKLTQKPQQSAKSTWRAAPQDNRRPVAITDSYIEKEKILDQALDEYCELMEEGKAPPPKEFCKQYPDYRHSLCRLIEVEVAMADEPALDEDLEAAWPKPMQQFLDYEIMHELGIGAFARVYLAAEQSLGGRLVAIKVSPYGSDEAKTLAKLTHPNIVPVFSVQREEATDMTAVCMPYHGSTTLADLLEAEFNDGKRPSHGDVIVRVPQERESVDGFVERSLKENEIDPKLQRGTYVDGVARLGIQMADALAYTHERGILHRDLKPSNVLLTPAGIPMLLDFNLASDIESGSGRLGGTLPYMPPEQIRDAHLQPLQSDGPGDPRSDVFSLGVILYELLTGQLPFGDPPATMSPREASTKYLEAQQTRPIRVNKLNPQVSPSLARTIHRCLSLDADRRPKSAVQLKKDLKRHFGWLAWLNRYRVVFMFALLIAMLVATQRLNSAATRESDYVLYMRQAIEALESKDFKSAIDLFGAARDAGHVQTVPMLFGRGYCYEQVDTKPSALSDLELASTRSNNVVIADCLAHLQIQEAQYLAAVATYQETITRDPDCALRYVSLAFCKLRSKRYKPAQVLPDLDKAIELDPDLQIAYHLRAITNAQSIPRKFHPISKSVDDANRAIELGDMYAQLACDSACVFSLAAEENPSYLYDTMLYLDVAVDAGLGADYLRNREEFSSWKHSDWFLEALSQCRPQGQILGADSLSRDRSVMVRNHDEIVEWLRTHSP